MSLLNQPFAMPSRVKGAVQLLAQERGARVKRNTAEALLSPASIKGDDTEDEKLAMVRRTIDECIRLTLFVAAGEYLELNDDLSEIIGTESVARVLPEVILERIVTENNTGNSDILAPLAWFLGQELANCPSSGAEFGKLLQDQGVADLFKFNDTKYDNFWYWSRYLGLTTAVGSPKPGGIEEWLVPDPTAALRNLLRQILVPASGPMHAVECFRQVSLKCQLFEGGTIREAMDTYAPARAAKHLSQSTSLALLRLEAEGTLAIRLLSDANALILVDGSARRPFSELAWAESAGSVA